MRLSAQRFSNPLAGYHMTNPGWIGMALLMAGCFLFGCGRSESPQSKETKPSSGNPITAPVDYLGAAAQAQKTRPVAPVAPVAPPSHP